MSTLNFDVSTQCFQAHVRGYEASYESHTIIAFWLFRNVIKHQVISSGPVAKIFYFSFKVF